MFPQCVKVIHTIISSIQILKIFYVQLKTEKDFGSSILLMYL
jgi:hypothetical protein